MNSQIAPHVCLPEPQLAFHPARSLDREIHPLRGLLEFGPYSATLVPDPIRIATIVPGSDCDHLYSFLSKLDSKYDPRERKDYLPIWPGFQSVFGLRTRLAGEECHIKSDNRLETKFRNSSEPHLVLAEYLVRAIQRLQANRTEFDIILIYIPKRWASGRYGGPNEDFNLHDHLKATAAASGLPTQLVEEDGAVSYRCEASVMWRLGLALYVKAGGIPWKLAETEEETAYIGISYAMRQTHRSGPQFITCCSQVFDAEGSGIEFVAYDTREVGDYGKNPFLSRNNMFRVMTRSMEIYRHRHAGRSPRRVMVHKNTEFKRGEVDGCMEALHLCEAVDLVQVVQDVAWRGVRIDRGLSDAKKGTPAAYPVARGTAITLSPREALLWTHGDVQGVSTRGSYFKGARSTPSPLGLVRHAGHGPWDDTARAILGLTKMNWNNDSLYDTLPITLAYAHTLARVIKRMPNLRRTPYQFRFFM